jgi:hypothetical protein
MGKYTFDFGGRTSGAGSDGKPSAGDKFMDDAIEPPEGALE